MSKDRDVNQEYTHGSKLEMQRIVLLWSTTCNPFWRELLVLHSGRMPPREATQHELIAGNPDVDVFSTPNIVILLLRTRPSEAALAAERGRIRLNNNAHTPTCPRAVHCTARLQAYRGVCNEI